MYLVIYLFLEHLRTSSRHGLGKEAITKYAWPRFAGFSPWSQHFVFDWMDLFVVCRLLNVPATCQCISGTDPLRQFYLPPHWDRSCRSSFSSHPVTVYWHRANQSLHWPYNARRQCQFFLGHWYDSTPVKSRCKQDSNPGSSARGADVSTTRPTRRSTEWKFSVQSLIRWTFLGKRISEKTLVG